MKIRNILTSLVVAVASAVVVSPAAAAPGPPSFYYLQIGGVNAGWLTSIDLSKAVTHTSTQHSTGALGTIVVTTGSGMSSQFDNWLHGQLHAGASPKVTIFMYDSTYTEAAEIQITNPRVTEMTLPIANISAVGPAAFKVSLQSTDMMMTVGATKQPPNTAPAWSGRKFKLNLGTTLDCSAVMSLSQLSYKPAGLALPTAKMTITINNNNPTDFVAWFNAFSQGKPIVIDGSLTMYADDGKTPEVVIDFKKISIQALNLGSTNGTPTSVANVTINEVTIHNP